MKLRHDFAGHYNRPDIFHLQINRARPSLYSVHGGAPETLPPPAAGRLGSVGTSGLLTPPGDDQADDGTPGR